jgi:hypothetical protein
LDANGRTPGRSSRSFFSLLVPQLVLLRSLLFFFPHETPSTKTRSRLSAGLGAGLQSLILAGDKIWRRPPCSMI